VKQAQLERKVKRGETSNQKMWWSVTNPPQSSAGIEVVATSKEEAIEKALGQDGYPSWANTRQSVVAKPLRPYEESPAAQDQPSSTNNWGIWITSSDRFVRMPGTGDPSIASLRRFPSRDAAGQFLTQTRAENPNMRSDIEIREIPADYQMPGVTNSQTDVNTLRPTGPGPWEVANRSNNQVYFNPEHTNRGAAETEARTWLSQNGHNPADFEVRTRQTASNADAAQGGLIDVEIEIPDTAPRTPTTPGQPQQQFTGEWKVVDPQGRIIYSFSGVGNNQGDANRVAMDWLRRNPQRMQAGVEVLPVMG
jgi:hypothetical protein